MYWKRKYLLIKIH